VITEHIQLLRQAEAERRKREQQAEEAVNWQTFERLRRHSTDENARAAKRAFLLLAKRHHPDQGGKPQASSKTMTHAKVTESSPTTSKGKHTKS
jgi:hypothetical protein